MSNDLAPSLSAPAAPLGHEQSVDLAPSEPADAKHDREEEWPGAARVVRPAVLLAELEQWHPPGLDRVRAQISDCRGSHPNESRLRYHSELVYFADSADMYLARASAEIQAMLALGGPAEPPDQQHKASTCPHCRHTAIEEVPRPRRKAWARAHVTLGSAATVTEGILRLAQRLRRDKAPGLVLMAYLRAASAALKAARDLCDVARDDIGALRTALAITGAPALDLPAEPIAGSEAMSILVALARAAARAAKVAAIDAKAIEDRAYVAEHAERQMAAACQPPATYADACALM